MFKFIHSADIHLASPLRRLERYQGAPVDRFRNATFQALENLVALAIKEEVDFTLIAGDLYDSDLDDYAPLIKFGNQMAELRRRGIRVFLIRGNHDAANHMSRNLDPPDNVHVFTESKPETVNLETIQVAVHGQSFASRETRENLVAGYPDPAKGWFNIGLLHTSLQGSDRHDTYAPCSLDHLRQRGYDYWALGHIHQRQLKNEDRPIVLFPGNTQGRNVGETGAKGCHLVSVENNQVVSNEFRPLDLVRWEWLKIDAVGQSHPKEVLKTCLCRIKECMEHAEGRLLVARVEVCGVTSAHAELAGRLEHWLSQLQSDCLNEFGQEFWLESLRLSISPPGDEAPEALPEDALEQLRKVIEELENDNDKLGEILQRELRILDRRLPAALKIGEEAMQLTKPEFGRPLLSQIIPLLTHLQDAALEAP